MTGSLPYDRSSDGRAKPCVGWANTSTGYRQLAEAQVLDAHDSWAPMALADGRLIVRDYTRMVCLDVARALAAPVVGK